MFVILESRGGVLATAFLIVSLSYFISVAIYRLYLSPIAKFPGPRLAAVTYLYEIYYDAVKRGKYTFKIRDLHAIYGQFSIVILDLECFHCCTSRSRFAYLGGSRTDHSNQPY